MMSKPLHILIVEDSEDDSLLLLRELRRAGYEPVYERVETPDAMRAALRRKRWDLVVSDYLMPHFSGLEALEMLKNSRLDLPFIIVSGNIGEEIAVEAMRAGAHDYIIKGSLARLIPAVERELREAEARRDRKRTGDQLDQVSRRLAETLETINEGFFTLDKDWRFTFVNTEAAEMWGEHKSDLIGAALWDLAPQAAGSVFEEQYRKVMKERVPVRFESISPMLGIWLEVRAHPSEDGIAVYFHDITDRKKAEEKISRLNRMYSVLSKVNEAIVRINDGQELYKEVCRITVEYGSINMAWIGLTDPISKRIIPAESCGDEGGYLNNIHVVAADAPEGRGPTGRAVVEGKYQICNDIEHDPQMAHWRDRALHHGFQTAAAFPLRSGGEVIGAFTVYGDQPKAFTHEEIELLSALAEDVSYAVDSLSKEKLRYEAEKKTEVTNELLKLFTQKYSRKSYLDAAVEIIHDWSGCGNAGIRVKDQEGHVPYVTCSGFDSSFIESESGLSLDEDNCVCTRVIAGVLDPADAAATTPYGSIYYNGAIRLLDSLPEAQKKSYRGLCQQRGFNSLVVVPVRYRETILGAIHLADGREGVFPLKTVEFLERMALIIGEALYRFSIEEQQVRLASAVEFTADAIVITEASAGKIQYVNSAFEEITGYAKDEVIGKTVHFLESGRHTRAFYEQLRETLKRDGVWRGLMMNKRKDGTQYYEDCAISPVWGASGELLNFVYLKRDVTEKLRLESIAESVSSMDSIGYIFSGVRHEIGNPVNSINMILGLMKSKLPTLSREAIADYLDRIIGQVGRVEFLLRSLKTFNMFESQEPQDLEIASFLDQFLPLIRDNFAKTGIELELKLDQQARMLRGDPRALQQVLLNLVTNASDAVADEMHPKVVFCAFKSGGMVHLQVEDNGCGIPEERKKDLFKPFYTTKAKGTGLGLVIVKKMLTKMNGTIELESRQGQGTTVTISLPEGKQGQ